MSCSAYILFSIKLRKGCFYEDEMPKSHANAFDGVCCDSSKVIAIDLKAYHEQGALAVLGLTDTI
jgi:hypothetical protein